MMSSVSQPNSKDDSATTGARKTPARILAAPVLILLGFLLVGLWYSLVIPAFETPDEIYHYAFARHLSQGNSLPVQTIEADGPWKHEGTQAPLYYLLLSPLISRIDQADFDQVATINPRANLGTPTYPGNKNFMLYSAVPRPLTGTNLAVHIGRWFSLLLSLGTLLLTFGIARLAFPRSPTLAVLVMATVAAIPQFGFISASVSNDALIIFVSTATLFWMLVLLQREDAAPISLLDWSILGVLLALAAISKLQGLSLYVLAGLFVPFLAWQRRDWRLLIRAGLSFALFFVAIAGWWYWRNYQLYGDFFAIGQLLNIEGLRTESQTWVGFWGELRGLRYSFWGLFGWFSILMPVWIYMILDGVTLLAVAGLALWAVQALGRDKIANWLRHAQVRVWLCLLIFAAILIGLMLYWLTFAISSQGRLLFPGISAYGVLIVGGLYHLLRRVKAPRPMLVLAVLPLLLAANSVYALTVLLPSSYRAVAPVAAVPSTATPVGKIYGDSLELVAIDLPTQRFKAGEDVPITLYVRALTPQTQDYELFVQLLNQDNLLVGNITTSPGWGRNPTSLWQPGVIYADTYAVTAWDNINSRSPLLAKVYVGFANTETGMPLLVQGDEVEPDNRTVGTVQLDPPVSLDPKLLFLNEVDIRFGQVAQDVIRLTGYRTAERLVTKSQQRVTVTLFWRATGTPSTNYTAFVHLIDADGTYVAGFDQPPAEGRFPTSLWRPGDTSLSDFTINVPPDLAPGSYELWAGLYDGASPTLDRLPITASDLATKDNRVLLDTVVIP